MIVAEMSDEWWVFLWIDCSLRFGAIQLQERTLAALLHEDLYWLEVAPGTAMETSSKVKLGSGSSL